MMAVLYSARCTIPTGINNTATDNKSIDHIYLIFNVGMLYTRKQNIYLLDLPFSDSSRVLKNRGNTSQGVIHYAKRAIRKRYRRTRKLNFLRNMHIDTTLITSTLMSEYFTETNSAPSKFMCNPIFNIELTQLGLNIAITKKTAGCSLGSPKEEPLVSHIFRSKMLMKTIIKYAAIAGVTMSVSNVTQASIVYSALDDTLNNGSQRTYDFNNDSIDDVSFLHTYTSHSRGSYGDLWANGLNGSLVSVSGPISVDTIIGGSTTFSDSNHLADYNYSWWSGSCGRWGCSPGGSNTSHLGSWNDDYSNVTGYLAFSLNDTIGTSYGWVNLTMYHYGGGTINSFGMETTHGKSIKAGDMTNTIPEPGTLALLALGAVGVGFARRRKATASRA